MLVRIGDRYFDSLDTPIVIVVEESERESLASLLMDEKANALAYATYDNAIHNESTIEKMLDETVEKYQEIAKIELDKYDK